MTRSENKKIKDIFPPLKRKNDFFSIKYANDDNTYQGGKKGRVKKASMAEEFIGRNVQPAIANDVEIGKARACDAQNPKFQGFFFGLKTVHRASCDD